MNANTITVRIRDDNRLYYQGFNSSDPAKPLAE